MRRSSFRRQTYCDLQFLVKMKKTASFCEIVRSVLGRDRPPHRSYSNSPRPERWTGQGLLIIIFFYIGIQNFKTYSTLQNATCLKVRKFNIENVVRCWSLPAPQLPYIKVSTIKALKITLVLLHIEGHLQRRYGTNLSLNITWN